MADENEDDLLRSVALENAQAILLARQRAEQELIRAKEALEQKRSGQKSLRYGVRQEQQP